jgi:hypothetical protein
VGKPAPNILFMSSIPDPTLRHQLDEVVGRVNVLEQRIHQRSVVIPIQSLEPAPVDVVAPILAVVQEEDGAFVASFVDANMNASGETQLDAMEMLKDVIASSFQLFLSKEQVLGEESKRQLAVLRHFVRLR